MSSTENCCAPMQPHHLFNLRVILRNANQRYQAIASSFRRSLRPTHHARNRAAALGLKVDISKAVRCPQKQVAVIPLPIIDSTPSPTVVRAASEEVYLHAQVQDTQSVKLYYPYKSSERPVIPPIVIPAPMSDRRRARNVSSKPAESDTESESARSVILAPTVLRGQNPWQGPTSRFSITPDNALFKVRVWDAESRQLAVPDVPGSVEDVGSWETSYLDLSNDEEVADKLENCRMSPSASSSSSQASESSGPSTPDELLPPLTISIKRKSIEVEDFDEYECTEKRLKYVRKDWIHSSRS